MANKIGAVMATVGELTDIDSTARNPLGTVATDAAGNEYIYLLGVGSVIAGTVVTYDEAFATTRMAANAVGPVAVAQAAVVANKYGWFMRKGTCSAEAVTVADNKSCYADANAGAIDDSGAAGDLIVGMWTRSTDAAGLATVQLAYPYITDVLG